MGHLSIIICDVGRNIRLLSGGLSTPTCWHGNYALLMSVRSSNCIPPQVCVCVCVGGGLKNDGMNHVTLISCSIDTGRSAERDTLGWHRGVRYINFDLLSN